MNPYKFSIFDDECNSERRFVLGTKGENSLITIGLNPSIANKYKSDRTISKVKGFSIKAIPKFDSYIMLNLYPQCAQKPINIHTDCDMTLHEMNIRSISNILTQIKNPSILAAWGETIKVRQYFFKCLKEIHEIAKPFNVTWLKIGELTKSGHPRHPSRATYTVLSKFDIKEYIDKMPKGN